VAVIQRRVTAIGTVELAAFFTQRSYIPCGGDRDGAEVHCS
jgi:hypothetical protein